jgi:hypothetical protein
MPRIYGTRKSLTLPTSARHLSLSWANSIQSPRLPPTSWRSILILSSYLRLGLPNGLFPSGFPTNTCTHLHLPPYAPHAQPISFVSILPPAQYWVRSTDHSAPRYAATEVLPSLNRGNQSNTCVRPIASSPNACCNNWYVSVTVFPILKQKLIQMLCSVRSNIVKIAMT